MCFLGAKENSFAAVKLFMGAAMPFLCVKVVFGCQVAMMYFLGALVKESIFVGSLKFLLGAREHFQGARDNFQGALVAKERLLVAKELSCCQGAFPLCKENIQ